LGSESWYAQTPSATKPGTMAAARMRRLAIAVVSGTASAFLAGTFVAGAFLAGTFLAGTFLAGTFLAGTLVAGAFLAGAGRAVDGSVVKMPSISPNLASVEDRIFSI
jgi:hypothetical protein